MKHSNLYLGDRASLSLQQIHSNECRRKVSPEDTTTMLKMTLRIMPLCIMKILITLNTGDISYNDINYN